MGFKVWCPWTLLPPDVRSRYQAKPVVDRTKRAKKEETKGTGPQAVASAQGSKSSPETSAMAVDTGDRGIGVGTSQGQETQVQVDAEADADAEVEAGMIDDSVAAT